VIAAAVLLAAACWAGTAEAELLVERAKVALREERPLEARAHALEALQVSPEVWSAYRVYLRAAAAAGMPERAEADFSDLRTRDPVASVVWSWWRVNAGDATLEELAGVAETVPDPGRLALAFASTRSEVEADVEALLEGDESSMATRLRIRRLRDAGQPVEAARLARRWLKTHPERPDVLSEIWPSLGWRGEGRQQRAALRAVDAVVPSRWDDPLYLFRALRMVAAAKESARSKELGARIRELGLVPPLHRPPWNASMQRAMGRTLAMNADAELPQASGSELLEITRSRVRYLLHRGRADEAISAWRQLRDQEDSYEAALAMAELLVELERPEPALAAVSEAIQLALLPATSDVSRVDAARQSVELGHAFGRRAEIATSIGREAALDRQLAARLAPHPRWGASEIAAPEPSTDDLVEGLRAEPVLLWSTVGSLLDPENAGYFLLRGRAQEAAGARDAAFASFTRADFLGAEVLDALERTYTGIASAEPAAMAVSSRQVEIAEAAEARRLAIYPPDGDPDPAIIAQAPSALAENRPRVGRRFPAWRASFGSQTLDPEALRGEVYVLAIWASWCGPCREELPEISRVVAGLRAEGLAIRGLAVSTDDDVAAYTRFLRREPWEALEVARDPQVGQRLRVSSLPTTWVVASDGTLVHQQIGFDPSFAGELERILRKHTP